MCLFVCFLGAGVKCLHVRTPLFDCLPCHMGLGMVKSAAVMKPGNFIYLDDGLISLEAKEIGDNQVKCKIVNSTCLFLTKQAKGRERERESVCVCVTKEAGRCVRVSLTHTLSPTHTLCSLFFSWRCFCCAAPSTTSRQAWLQEGRQPPKRRGRSPSRLRKGPWFV